MATVEQTLKSIEEGTRQIMICVPVADRTKAVGVALEHIDEAVWRLVGDLRLSLQHLEVK